MENNGCGECGLFDFMANQVGIKVLHPGGYKSTDELCSPFGLNKDSHVLDVACGAGTTAFHLVNKYGCKVIGFDISESLIAIANKKLEKSNRKNQIQFDVANALDISYPDNTFDTVISQAFFILIDEKKQALKEITRVLKPGGYFGALELSWFEDPPEEAYQELLENTCQDFIPRVVRFEEWEKFFESANLSHMATSKYPMTSGVLKMFESEGFYIAIKIMLKMLGNSQMRKRMMSVQNTFRKNNDYLGYGIFGYRK